MLKTIKEEDPGLVTKQWVYIPEPKANICFKKGHRLCVQKGAVKYKLID